MPVRRSPSSVGSGIMANTGQEMDRSRDMERDYFAAPQEAKDYGIIDIVISPPGHCERRESA